MQNIRISALLLYSTSEIGLFIFRAKNVREIHKFVVETMFVSNNSWKNVSLNTL